MHVHVHGAGLYCECATMLLSCLPALRGTTLSVASVREAGKREPFHGYDLNSDPNTTHRSQQHMFSVDR